MSFPYFYFYMYPIKSFFIFAGFFCISLLAIAQPHVFVDPLPTSVPTRDGHAGVYYQQYKWTNGSTITVDFLIGSVYVQSARINVIRSWDKHANRKFNFCISGNSDNR